MNHFLQRPISVCTLIAAAAVCVCAQPAPGGLTFEVASVKLADTLSPEMVMSGKMRLGMVIDGARVDIGGLSITDMIRMAYKIKNYQVQGPDWLGGQRFDIQAKLPAGATRDQVPEMLQALLAERFKLTFHKTNTEHNVYGLIVVKGGPKLTESAPDPADAAAPADPGAAQVRASATSDAKGTVTSAGPNGTSKMVMGPNGMRIEMTKMTTIGMVDLLSRFVDKPIVDMTNLTSRYDLTIDVSMEDVMNLARSQGMNVGPLPSSGTATDPSNSSVFNAIQPYGLKLEPRKAPIEFYVIDHVEKLPTDN
jgi:uncharacterized protein (TIGR03435 family)